MYKRQACVCVCRFCQELKVFFFDCFQFSRDSYINRKFLNCFDCCFSEMCIRDRNWCKRKKYAFNKSKAEEIYTKTKELVPVFPKNEKMCIRDSLICTFFQFSIRSDFQCIRYTFQPFGNIDVYKRQGWLR